MKVLDFGLAKAIEPERLVAERVPVADDHDAAMRRHGRHPGDRRVHEPGAGPWKPLDKRADIWAFGCVLYEMLRGKRAFEGEDVTEILAAVVRAEPDWAELPAEAPAPIRKLLRRCIEKDRKCRRAGHRGRAFRDRRRAYCASQRCRFVGRGESGRGFVRL